MEPWETMHEAAHAYAVERLNEAIEKVRSAGGWLGILPETSDHVAELLTDISASLASVLRSVDRPTVLKDFDNELTYTEPLEGVEPTLSEKIVEASKQVERKTYKFDDAGDIDA